MRRSLISTMLLAGCLAAISAPVRAMSFDFQTLNLPGCGQACPKVIVASGEIYLGDAETFFEKVKAAIAREPRLTPVVLIHSQGGNMAAALQLGQVFRAMRATVIVARARQEGAGIIPVGGGCASACVFALMGGSRRVVPDDSRVGVHWVSPPQPQSYFGNTVQPDSQHQSSDGDTENTMRSYMRRMGVRADLAAFIRKVPHSSLHVMTPGEITRFGLARRTF